jgi:hypothetical protein
LKKQNLECVWKEIDMLPPRLKSELSVILGTFLLDFIDKYDSCTNEVLKNLEAEEM